MNDNKPKEKSQTVQFSVYVIWCRVTGKFYVGVTRQKSVYKRIRQHMRGKKRFIDLEIKRIGWENHWDYWVVEKYVPSERISECEQRWIAFFDCVYPKGYNKTCGGIGNIIVSDDTREKIRQRALERDISGEKNPHYGKKHTAEVNAANSARMRGENNPMYGKSPANKGKTASLETKTRLSAIRTGEKNPFYGKHHTEEAKERNRQAHLGKHLTEEHKAKLRGRKRSEETKAKMREKALARAAAKRAAKAVAEENLAAANSTPTSLSTLLDAVILQKGLRA